jgi:hypothetical protein
MSVKTAASYLERRLLERSFWLQCGAAIIPAIALPAPWRFISIGVAVIAALVPDGVLGQTK